MIKSLSNNHVSKLLIIAQTFILCSCGGVNIEQAPASVSELSSDSLFCAIAPKEIGQFTNVLFVIDQSGSNVAGTNSNGTDPTKLRRGQAMQTFLDQHRTNSYLKWGFISFNGEVGAKSFINKPSGSYFGSAVDMDSALVQFHSTRDYGKTPYESALTMTRTAIEKELSLDPNAANASFAVIFISDGRPDPEIIPASRLFDLVSGLTTLNQGGVHVSTVYYNTSAPDITDSQRLEEMARVGKGKFQDASSGQTSISIEELIVGGVYLEPYTMADLFIYNLNSTTCDDGLIGVDSDADGLCDGDEENYNNIYAAQIDKDLTLGKKRFSSTNRNSFLNNYSDYFILRKLRGERLPDCTDTERETYVDMLNACEKKFLVSPYPVGPTPQWTDELYKNGKKALNDYYDSDGDNILDGLELFFFKDKGAPLNYYNQYIRTNGIENLELFRNHQHPLRPETSKAYSPKLTFVNRNDQGELCYQYSQQSLSLYNTKAVNFEQSSQRVDLIHENAENVILVYYVLKTENSPNGKGVLKYSYQRKKFGQSSERVDLAKGRFETFRPVEERTPIQ